MFVRFTAALVVALALVLGLGVIFAPAQAWAGTSTEVQLHPPHVGTESDDCGAGWHFVVNQLEEGHVAGTLTATFQNAGTVQVDANKVLRSVQHFDVVLGGADTLLSASVIVSGDHPEAKLLLSHVECVTNTSTTSTTVAETTTTVVETTTTTVAETTTTTVAETTTTSVTESTLPATGIENGQATGLVAGLLIVAGMTTLAFARGRKEF